MKHFKGDGSKLKSLGTCGLVGAKAATTTAVLKYEWNRLYDPRRDNKPHDVTYL
jgi:hypothetical protein